MAYGSILGQAPIFPENPSTIATNVSYDNSTTSSAISSNNVQGAIDQLFTSVSNGKAQIASAITAKGVATSSDATFQTMANNIGGIVSINEFNINNFQSAQRSYNSVLNSVNLTFEDNIKYLVISISGTELGLDDSNMVYSTTTPRMDGLDIDPTTILNVPVDILKRVTVDGTNIVSKAFYFTLESKNNNIYINDTQVGEKESNRFYFGLVNGFASSGSITNNIILLMCPLS